MQRGQYEAQQRQVPVQVTSIPFFWELVPWPYNGTGANGHATAQMQKGIAVIPRYTEVCNPLWKLTLVKTEWPWNGMYQDLYDKAKYIIRLDPYIKLYDASKPLYWQMPPMSAWVQACYMYGMEWTVGEIPESTALWPITFASKSLSSAEWQNRNILWEALDILHELENFTTNALPMKFT